MMKYNIDFKYTDKVSYSNDIEYTKYKRDFEIDRITINKTKFNETELNLLKDERSLYINETYYLIKNIKLSLSEDDVIIIFVENADDRSDDLPF